MVEMTSSGTMRLLKLHGLGNDFLVLVDRPADSPLRAEQARRWCDRHTGVGADGLIRVTPAGPGEDGIPGFVMELLNGDGSRAETSGNGLRCLALALRLEGLLPADEVRISTDAGARWAKIGPLGPDGSASVTVEMGEASLVQETEVSGRRAELVDVGNPHLVVLVDDLDRVEVEVEGPAEEHRHEGGLNVNFVAVADRGRIRLRTWERGAGATLACGSGSVAAAAALRGWGLVGDQVAVDNPGGEVTVVLTGADRFRPEALLTGPAQLIARVEVLP
jgi:diaminopimelate epimerase